VDFSFEKKLKDEFLPGLWQVIEFEWTMKVSSALRAK
jgi:hypothetical protein